MHQKPEQVPEYSPGNPDNESPSGKRAQKRNSSDSKNTKKLELAKATEVINKTKESQQKKGIYPSQRTHQENETYIGGNMQVPRLVDLWNQKQLQDQLVDYVSPITSPQARSEKSGQSSAESLLNEIPINVEVDADQELSNPLL